MTATDTNREAEPKDYTVCEYFCQGDDSYNLFCEECGSPLSEYDRGYGTPFYSVGPESVRWSVGDGAIICPGCIGDNAKNAVRPLE